VSIAQQEAAPEPDDSMATTVKEPRLYLPAARSSRFSCRVRHLVLSWAASWWCAGPSNGDWNVDEAGWRGARGCYDSAGAVVCKRSRMVCKRTSMVCTLDTPARVYQGLLHHHLRRLLGAVERPREKGPELVDSGK
jgi:hypothetical protein